MDKEQAARDIITHALPLVPFDGWTQATLQKAARAAGLKATDVIRVFPGGAIDAVDHVSALDDARMLEELTRYNFSTMKIRERIATAVRVRISLCDGYREAVRKTIAMHALPFYIHRGLRNLYRTVDDIWHACGDTSTDFNFYTKRLMLAGVYSSTLVFWLDDASPGKSATWDFLDRRIDDVMRIEGVKQKFRKMFG